MEYEYDENKNQSNIQKHGVSFNKIEGFIWAEAAFEIDERNDYSEVRVAATGPIGTRIYQVIYTIRNNSTYRIISLRKANKREVRRYANHN